MLAINRSGAIPPNKCVTLQSWLYGGIVGAVMAAYYAIFFFPPRLVGVNEPDRFYHLGLSQLMSTEGLLRTLPQVEDLGWGRYFPDKEFLFHALTGAAYWLAGPVGVMLVVPLLGIGIIVCLYAILSRVLSPRRATVLVLAASLLSPVFVFRITLLRPHLLSILFFCLLVGAILRGRALLAAIAAAGFALSYHAFYIPVLAIVVAAAFQWPEETKGARVWRWAILGLACGIVLNPYFPSTLVMSWDIVKIALGIGLPPGLRSGEELQPLSLLEYIGYFGFLPLAVLGAGTLIVIKRLRPAPEIAGFWFLFVLSLLLTLLSMKSSRVAEYAVPSIILLVGYALSLAKQRWWLWLTCVTLVVAQGSTSWTYYTDIWSRPQGGESPWYLEAIALLPPEADGQKVFNCQWVAGSYLLFARPRVRFVDLLEPALLWNASPGKYVARQRLLSGLDESPQRTLRELFKANYVLCGSEALNRQMQADPRHFEPITGSAPMGPLRVYRILD